MDLSRQASWWRVATATMTSQAVWNAPKQPEEKFEISSEVYSEQVRWVAARNDTILSILSLGGRKDLWSITPHFPLILDRVSSTCAAIHEDVEARWEQNSLMQISSAFHHHPALLEADARDVGTQHEWWEHCVKFFHEYVLQTGQDQKVSVYWGDFIRYPFSLLMRTSKEALIEWGQSSLITDDKVCYKFVFRKQHLVSPGATALLPATLEEDSWPIAVREKVRTAFQVLYGG